MTSAFRTRVGWKAAIIVDDGYPLLLELDVLDYLTEVGAEGGIDNAAG